MVLLDVQIEELTKVFFCICYSWEMDFQCPFVLKTPIYSTLVSFLLSLLQSAEYRLRVVCFPLLYPSPSGFGNRNNSEVCFAGL